MGDRPVDASSRSEESRAAEAAPGRPRWRRLAWVPGVLLFLALIAVVTHLSEESGLLGCGALPRYPPVLAGPRAGDRILIVAPHVDDEAIAAGGYTVEALTVGAQVFVVYLTAGDGGFVSAEIEGRTPWPRPRDYLREGTIRISEAHAVMALLGVPRANVFILGYPDGDLLPMVEHPEKIINSRTTRDRSVPYAAALSPGAPYRLASLEADLARVFAAASPTRVIAPVTFDAHPDHRAGAVLVRRLLATLHEPPPLLGYLVHGRGFPAPFRFAPQDRLLPPRRLDGLAWRSYPLTPAAQKRKQAALHLYKSQRIDPYLRLLLDAFARQNELFVEEVAKAPGDARDHAGS